jgi:hypothetical protein
MSLVSSGVIAQLYAWPRLRMMNRDQALLVLVAPHMLLRFTGLSFLVVHGGRLGRSFLSRWNATARFSDVLRYEIQHR